MGSHSKFKIVDFNITEVVSLKNRLYSYISMNECMRCNQIDSKCELCKIVSTTRVPGFRKSVLKKVKHDYIRQLVTSSLSVSKFADSEIFTSDRIGFHALDVRRYLNEDKITTKAFGNMSIRS